ncbi:hypothetical protein ASG56_06735 [Rhodococcus sp. Leaf7]|uniref:hypothetical protein n=1 Tax=unclassified Rhodococcus (in: high G+C Gram-positive bacteria) TaxID=192944 RepID=UPI0006FE4DBD|nr:MULTISPECIES: hypothetical protein [unclassified Rhodococcus (in: high G+C Gram-positive bacteria)]KQU07226.1 hypothetical protein ASG56_06735 [Rhodococcus sp. Leaf7]KQU42744.1 hypothetical protein ASG64_06735 [Rhodococcus sp. Leaf247]
MSTENRPQSDRSVGLHVTDLHSTAVVVATGSGELVRVPVVHDTVLYLRPDGTSTLRRPDTMSTDIDVVDRFVTHVGDPAGVVSARGVPMRAEDLMATAMFLLLTEVSDAGEDVTGITAGATHPRDWSSDRIDALRESLDFLGLQQVSLHPESTSASATLGHADSRLASAVVAARAATGVPAAPTDSGAPARKDRRLVFAIAGMGILAAILVLAAGVTYLMSGRTTTTAVPVVENATTTQTTTTTRAAPSSSIGFPTVVPGAPAPAVPTRAPAVVPRTTAAAPPPPAPPAPAPAPAPEPAPVTTEPTVTEELPTTTPDATPSATASSASSSPLPPPA